MYIPSKLKEVNIHMVMRYTKHNWTNQSVYTSHHKIPHQQTFFVSFFYVVLALSFPICESFYNTGQVCTQPHVLVINCPFYLPWVHDWQWSSISTIQIL